VSLVLVSVDGILTHDTAAVRKVAVVELPASLAGIQRGDLYHLGGSSMARSELAQPSRVTLDRYRQLMHIPMCAFNGVDNPNENKYGCDTIWTQAMRDEIAFALYNAEELLEADLRYTLSLKYQADYDHDYTNPIILKWGYIIGGGIRARDEVTPSASDFTTDPATITVAQSDFPGGTGEIVIIETSTGLEIEWDSVEASGTDYIISISQCKLIEWDDLENQRTPIEYDNTFPAATWLKLTDLTVYREYRDVSSQATIVYGPYCACLFSSGSACAGVEYDGCVWIKDWEVSEVTVQAATYSPSAGSWSHNSVFLTGCYEGDKTDINYLAGKVDEPGSELAIRKLAHALAAMKPCGCALVDNIWRQDTTIPERISFHQANNPFGQANGAWWAWQWSQAHKLGDAYLGIDLGGAYECCHF
jgi:hypothetical protein